MVIPWSPWSSSLSFCSISLISRWFILLNKSLFLIFSSLVKEYWIYSIVLLLNSITNRIFKDSSSIKLSLMSKTLMLLFSMRAEHICCRPVGPILLLWRFKTSIVFVSLIKLVISIAPLFPSWLSLKSRIFRSLYPCKNL